MGKVTNRNLPADHPIFTGGWSLATIRRPVKKDTTSKKNKEAVKGNKKDEQMSSIKLKKSKRKVIQRLGTQEQATFLNNSGATLIVANRKTKKVAN